MIAIDAVQRGIILVKKYWGYLCVPILLIAAYIYVDSTHPFYRVSTKIALKNVSPHSVVADLQSHSMIRKAVNSLPLQASYFDENSPRAELSAESLRAHLEFTGPSKLKEETWLTLIADSGDVVGLNRVDTTAYYEFNTPVHESYGDFKIIHGANRVGPAICLVKLQGQNELVAQYASALRFDEDDTDGSVTVSVRAGTPKKGVDFLNQMLKQYQDGKHSAALYASLRGTVSRTGGVAVPQRPEFNIEEASVNPFWVYLAATMSGFLLALGISSAKRRRKPVIVTRPSFLPKLAHRIQHGFAVRQLD